MVTVRETDVATDLVADLERRFFWWQPIGSRPRSTARIVAQAMNFASFADVRRLEAAFGSDYLANLMINAEPGWLNERSWESGSTSLFKQQI
jgi:hypothetical protein